MDPEKHCHQRQYGEPERCSQRREYGEPETRSQRWEFRESSSGQWDNGLEKRGNGQGMAREPYSEYSSMRRTREGWEEYGASSDMSYIMDPSSRGRSRDSLRGSGAPFSPGTDGDVDGYPVALCLEDLELLRNRMELEIIEEQLACKISTVAMETVVSAAKAFPKQKMKDKDLEMFTENVYNKDATLKARVNTILRKRAWTKECRSMEAADQHVPLKLVLRPPKVVSSFVEGINESILCKDRIVKDNLTLDVHEKEHPLRLKVEALLEQRRHPTVSKEDKAAKGFQYFLNVLNKGVDIDKLSKIVNNFKDLPSVGEELPPGQATPLDGQPETTSKSERKVASRKRHSRFDENPSPHGEEKREGRSEDDQEYGQIQSRLEELGRLTDRTQERFYGKKRDREKKGSEKEKKAPSHKVDQERERKEEKKEERERKCHSRSLLSDSSNSSPPRHRWTAEYKSSRTRDQDRDRDWGRSERNRDRDRGRSERDRDRGRSERDRDRGRSERNRDRDRGRSERNRERDIRSSTRDLDRDRWWETDRKIRSSTRDRDRESDWSRSEGNRLSSARDGSEKDWDRDRSERDQDRGRWWEQGKDWDGDKESFMGLYPYSNDPTHPHASLMATYSVQDSQYLANHVPLLPNPLGYPLYPNCPPDYYNVTSETFFQAYTQTTGNLQFTNMDVQVQDPDPFLSIPEQDMETVRPTLVYPSIIQDSKKISKRMRKRERYRINLSRRELAIKNILSRFKDKSQVAAKEPPSKPGTKKEPEGEAVIEGEKLHPPVATKDSEAPQNKTRRKGETLEEKGGIYNQGISIRVNRTYAARRKLRLAEAVAKDLEVPSEPEPKTEAERKAEWQRLFADAVAKVAATDLFALSEPEAERKPDGETEQKMRDEEMKAKLKKKLDEFNLKMKQKSTHLKEAPAEASKGTPKETPT